MAPLPVALPLVVAAVLIACAHILPPQWPDAISSLTAAVVAVIAVYLAGAAAAGPLVYWYGGWTPRHGVAIGIAFVVDPAGAGCAAFVAVLFVASFVFAWGYFDEVHARYHALMLIFLAAMAGFSLTGDLFNFFVFFELMSTVAFALTGYKLESSALEGALNFTVTNGIGSFLMLGGIGLVYGRTGALNFAQLSRALAGHPADALVVLGFTLLIGALLIKAAIVPFHFWIADAHSVAPSPVCVIFSGVMVPLALFGAARLYWSVFRSAGFDPALLRGLLVSLGTATALLGGAVALMQRDVKRLLAFSTTSHMGVLLVGIGLLSAQGLAGGMLYLLGHGMVKGALFMVGGILLAACAGIDEIELRGAGKGLPAVGIAYALGGLLLAGLPLGLEHQGRELIDTAAEAHGYSYLGLILSIAGGLTSAGILRGAGRIFLALGPEPGEEEESPSEEEREKQDRPVWLMLLPIAVLLAAELVLELFPIGAAVRRAAAAFTGTGPLTAHVLDGAAWTSPPPPPAGHGTHAIGPAIGLGVAVAIAALQLARDHLPKLLPRISHLVLGPVLAGLDHLHNGVVGDYVAWILLGLIVFGGVLAVG
ncbi:MAG TPA: proton-conducting transporter membrane subunit [Stellaceae bacterium]